MLTPSIDLVAYRVELPGVRVALPVVVPTGSERTRERRIVPGISKTQLDGMFWRVRQLVAVQVDRNTVRGFDTCANQECPGEVGGNGNPARIGRIRDTLLGRSVTDIQSSPGGQSRTKDSMCDLRLPRHVIYPGE